MPAISSASSVRAEMSPADLALPPLPPPPDLAILCEAPPDLGPEIDSADFWKIVPAYYLDDRVYFTGGTMLVHPPAAEPAALVCLKTLIPVRNRIHVKGRWRIDGVPAEGGFAGDLLH